MQLEEDETSYHVGNIVELVDMQVLRAAAGTGWTVMGGRGGSRFYEKAERGEAVRQKCEPVRRVTLSSFVTWLCYLEGGRRQCPGRSRVVVQRVPWSKGSFKDDSLR